MRIGSFVLLFIFAVMALMACAEENEGAGAGFEQGFKDIDSTIAAEEGRVDPSLLTPEADGTFSMADTPTPVPDDTPIPEPTSTPAPTAIPTPTFSELYWDDVVAALHTYFAAYHSRSQSAMDSVRTAASIENENASLEVLTQNAAMGRSWSDYPDIEIVEIRDIKCDKVLCRVLYDAISHPPIESRDASFDITDKLYFRLVDGRWLDDHTSETWRDEWDSTHRP